MISLSLEQTTYITTCPHQEQILFCKRNWLFKDIVYYIQHFTLIWTEIKWFQSLIIVFTHIIYALFYMMYDIS